MAEPSSTKQAHRFLDGVAFDWTVVLVGSWLVGGFYLDAWAHHHTTLETFFVGGLGDMLWHIVFGIEVDTEALLSPTHLVLATGGILMMTGALRAAWLRPSPATERLVRLLPALISAGFALSALHTFTEYANAFSSPWAEAIHRSAPADLGQSLGVASILLQTVLLMGFTLALTRRWSLPFGSLTLLFTVSGLLTVIPHSQFLFLSVAVISGVVGDVAYRWLRPRDSRPNRTRPAPRPIDLAERLESPGARIGRIRMDRGNACGGSRSACT
jgi:hypothetical protein